MASAQELSFGPFRLIPSQKLLLENDKPVRLGRALELLIALVGRLAASDRVPAHLLIGSDAVRYAGEAEAARKAEADRWRELSMSTDYVAA